MKERDKTMQTKYIYIDDIRYINPAVNLFSAALQSQQTVESPQEKDHP